MERIIRWLNLYGYINPIYFKKYLRLMPDEFEEIKTLVKPHLKKHPAGRKALSVGHRIAITLRFLASGDSISSIAFAFRVGFLTAAAVIKETTNALYTGLKEKYLKVPDGEEWKTIEEEFWKKWQYPNCLGTVDGKHIRIEAPPKSGSKFFNYKSYFSTVLFAVVDANFKFIVCDIGGYGSSSDGGLWKASSFGSHFDAGKVKIPGPKPFPKNSQLVVPHVVIGDEAFQLRPNFMRPFPGKQLNDTRRIYNYRRARRCVENAFGILVARWRILSRVIHAKPETVDAYVKACVVLHNFLMVKSEKAQATLYYSRGFGDEVVDTGELIAGEWRREVNLNNSLFEPLSTTQAKKFSNDAFEIRENFVKFFSGRGSVPWQTERAGINEIYKE